MAKKFILRTFYFLISIPLIVLSKVFCSLNFWGLRNDYYRCQSLIRNSEYYSFSDATFECVVVAEDHRNYLHYGMDFIAIIRAAIQCFKGNIQGASTIEQQFVRVAIGNYERTIKRKVREIFLALLISSRHSKKDISKAYLSVAYYGTGLTGLSGIKSLLKNHSHSATYDEAISVVSRLKYPETDINKKLWFEKHERRKLYIKDLLKIG